MQRSMVMQQATTISGDQLAKRLRAREGRPGRQSFLLLDCRPFIAYNVGHVRGAINVNCCDRFNRKRLQQVKIPKLELTLVGQYTQALWPTHICIQFKWQENFQKANSARLLYFTMIYLNMNDPVPFQGKASLADLATTKEGKEALKKRNWKEVVVYDDSSEDLSSLPYSHTLFLVINSLLEDGRQPVMLIGGLRAFQVSLFL